MSFLWFAFISARIVQKCIDASIRHCLGCQDQKISPLLHSHHQFGLKQKLERFMECAISEILRDLPNLAARFAECHDIDDKHQLIDYAKTFLISCTPNSIMYGGYITPENEHLVYGNIRDS